MTAIFVLDVPENEGVVRVAEQDALLQVEKVGPTSASTPVAARS